MKKQKKKSIIEKIYIYIIRFYTLILLVNGYLLTLYFLLDTFKKIVN